MTRRCTDTAQDFDLRKHKFPNVTGLDIAFPTFGTDPVLLVEARKRGYYNGHLSGNKMFSQLFFIGGKVKFRKDVPVEFQKDVWNYCRAFMGSFAPKHEEKDAIAGMLLDEIAESVEAAS